MKKQAKNLVFRAIKALREYAKNHYFNGFALLLAFNIASASVMPITAPAVAHDLESAIAETSLVDISGGERVKKKMVVVITGYSSTPDQTDDTPFITASGAHVEDGIVAANFLPFNTKVQIPKLFGDKVFVVKDRMNRRFSDRMDIWFADRSTALKFGKRTAEIVVL